MQFSRIVFLVLSLRVAGVASAQQPANVSLGFGVDTSDATVAAIVRTATDYFRLRGAGYAPTPLWNAAEQERWKDYDLTADLVFQGLAATIVAVLPAPPDGRDYIVKTLFAHSEPNGGAVRPIAMQRLYASPRSDGRWELGGALNRLTADWSTRSVRNIVYHLPPSWKFDEDKAARAARFLDSAARALQVPRPERIDYYLTSSAEEMYRIIGLDYFVIPSGGNLRGGKSFPGDGVVLSGDPSLGEAYFHELAHVVLGVHFPNGVRNTLVNEGFATWMGGSRGRSFVEMMRVLGEYQEANPKMQFAQLVSGPSVGWRLEDTDAFYATGALIFDVVHMQNGISGVRRLLGIKPPNRAVEPELRLMLQVFQGMDNWWRTETRRVLLRSRSASRNAR